MRLRTLALCLLPLANACAQNPPSEKPISIEQAIQEAIEHNLDLAAEKLNVSIAEARRITAAIRPNPVLTVSGQTLDLLGAKYNPATPLGPNQLNIHTDFPFERGGKRQQRIALATEDKTLAQLGVRELMRQVIGAVQNAFVDVQQAKENLKLAQGNLARLESIVRINEARLNAGDLARVELDRSRVAALQYRTAAQQAQLVLDQAKAQLQLVLGRKQRSLTLDVEGELRRDGLSQTQAEVTQLAITRRPDYLSNQQFRARSQADLKLQLANGKVDYTIGSEFTRQTAWGLSGNSVGIYFSAPLPMFNRNQGEIARAQRTIAAAEARSASLGLSIDTEVDKAYRQYTVSRQILDSVETDMLGRARSVLDTTEYSYKRGEASLVEFLDAQRAFNDAMQTFNDARASYARSLYLIDTVSGATVSSIPVAVP